MLPELHLIFSAYHQLCSRIDNIFNEVAQIWTGCVHCSPGCSDCCNALFDISLVEAMYINDAFRRTYAYGLARSEILERAGSVDRKLARLKYDLFLEEKEGRRPEEIIRRASRMRMRCPLLGNEGKCMLYEHRPIACRIYGIPLAIDEETHVCGFSSFQPGHIYPSIKIKKINHILKDLSKAIGSTIKSSYSCLHETFIPISMALLTDYSESYLDVNHPCWSGE